MTRPVYNRVVELAEYVGTRDTGTFEHVHNNTDQEVTAEVFLGLPEIHRVRVRIPAGGTVGVPRELVDGLVKPPHIDGTPFHDCGHRGLERVPRPPVPVVDAAPVPKVGAKRSGGTSGAPAQPS